MQLITYSAGPRPPVTRVVTFLDPFDYGRNEIEEFPSPARLRDLVPSDRSLPFVVLLNGKAVLEKDWASTIVGEEDLVVVLRLPAGGGGGKDILRTTLMIALVIASSVLLPGAGSAVFSGLSTTGAAVAAATVKVAVVTAGSLLINALIPPSSPTMAPAPPAASPERSPTYSLQAAGNKARLGDAVPVQYGRLQFFPDYGAQPWTTYEGDSQQWLHQLFILGHGEYDIEAYLINGQDIDDFRDVQYWTYGPGSHPDLFPTQVYNAPGLGAVEIPPDGTQTLGVIVNPAGTRIQTIHVDAVAPRGLFRLYKNNPPESAYDIVYVNIRILGRKVDQAGAPLTGWQTLHEWPGTYQTINPWRMTFYAFHGDWPADWDRIEVAVQRFDAMPQEEGVNDDVYWESARGFVAEATGELYRDTTKVAVRLRATDQITSQAAQRFSVIATRKIPVWDGNAWSAPQTSRSVAWAIHDALVNTEYGAGMDPSRVDVSSLEYLDGLGLNFDGRFDQLSTVWSVLATLARAARAAPYVQGGVVRVVRDETGKLPVAAFSERNIVKDSFSIDYSVPDELTAEAVKVSYWDETVWTERQVAVRYDGVEISAEDVQATVTLFGVTSRDVAFADAWYLARSNRFRRRFVSFRTEMEGFIPSLGDAISISHDMPGWGQAMDVVSWNGGTREAQFSDVPDWGAGALFVAMRKPDGTLDDAINIVQGATERHAILDNPPSFTPYTGADRERTHAVIGTANNWRRVGIVTETRPTGGVQVEINAVIDDDRPHDTPPDTPPPPASIYPPCTDPGVTNLVLYAEARETNLARAAWNGPDCASSYDVEYAEDIATPVWHAIKSTTLKEVVWETTLGWNIQVRVRAVGDNKGPWTVAKMADMPPEGNPLVGPDPPTNIVATSLVGGVLLEWDNVPRILGVRIWRNTVDDSQTADLIASTGGSRYSDIGMDPLGVEYWYWLQSYDRRGGGALSAPVSAIPEEYAEDIIDTIKGQINEAWLTDALNDRLNLIDADGDGLVDQVDGLWLNVNAIFEDLDLLRGTKPWAADIDFKQGDYCIHNGVLYVAVRDMPAPSPQPPATSADWKPIGAHASVGDSLAAHSVDINTLRVDVDKNTGDITVVASSIELLSAQVLRVNLLTSADYSWGTSWNLYTTIPDTTYAFWTENTLGVPPAYVPYLLAIGADSSERVLVIEADLLPADESLVAIIYQQPVPVVEDRRYQASVYVGSHRCVTELVVAFYDANDEFLGKTTVDDEGQQVLGGPNLEDYFRLYLFATAPTGAAWAQFSTRMVYKASLGGAQALPRSLSVRPMLADADEEQEVPNLWTLGYNANAGAIRDLTVRVTENENGISANAQAITALETTVDDENTGVSANALAISVLNTTVYDQNTGVAANASAITVLQSTVDDETNGVAANASAISDLKTQANSQQDEIDALAAEQLVLIAASGANLARDPIFQFDTGWRFYKDGASDFALSYAEWPASPWALNGYEDERTALLSASFLFSGYYGNLYQDVPVVQNRWYQFSVYVGIHRCRGRLIIQWLDQDGNEISNTGGGPTATTGGLGGPSLEDFVRLFFTAQAPVGATTARINIRADFHSSQSNPRLFISRPFFATASEDQTEPADWKPGDQSPIVAALQREGMVWVDDGTGGGTYTVQIEVDDAGSLQQVGFGMSVLKEQNRWVSDFRINATRFAIMDPNVGEASADYPFIVQSGTVYIEDAKIANASIDNAKIANLTVTAAKIADEATSVEEEHEFVRTFVSSQELVEIPLYLGDGDGDETRSIAVVMNAYIEKAYTTQRCEVNLFMQLQGSGNIFDLDYSVETNPSERYGNHPIIRLYKIPPGAYRSGLQNIRMWITPTVSSAFVYCSILLLGVKK